MSTIYGTISTASPPPESPIISRGRQRFGSGIGKQRPWQQMLVSFSVPESLKAAAQRLPTNAVYFHVNYAVVVLFMVFVSLLWFPVSLIVRIVTIFAWLFLYFLRDTQIVLWGYGVDERIVVVLLSIFTVVFLLLTNATVFIAGLAAGTGVAVVHAVFRSTNDLDFGEEEDGGGGEAMGVREAAATASYSVL